MFPERLPHSTKFSGLTAAFRLTAKHPAAEQEVLECPTCASALSSVSAEFT